MTAHDWTRCRFCGDRAGGCLVCTAPRPYTGGIVNDGRPFADPPTLWDPNAGRAARDEGMAHVVEPMPALAWSTLAWVALTTVCRTRPTLTSETVWRELERMDVPRPDDPRAMGPVMMRGVREGIIAAIDTGRSEARTRHAGLVTIYRAVR